MRGNVRAIASPALISLHLLHYGPTLTCLDCGHGFIMAPRLHHGLTLTSLDCRHNFLKAPRVCCGPTLTSLDCRHEFTMARSKANWRRLKEIGSHFTQYKEYWVHLQRWEAPWESAGAMAGMAALAYYPHLVLAGCLVSQMVDAAPQGW